MGHLMRWRLLVKGGPYDGTPGLYWHGDEEHPPPKRIHVGMCKGDGLCHASQEQCRRIGRGRAHPSYWTEEEERPTETVEYPRKDLRDAKRDDDPVAVYAIGNTPVEPAAEEDELTVDDILSTPMHPEVEERDRELVPAGFVPLVFDEYAIEVDGWRLEGVELYRFECGFGPPVHPNCGHVLLPATYRPPARLGPLARFVAWLHRLLH